MRFSINLLNGHKYEYHKILPMPIGYVIDGYRYICFDTSNEVEAQLRNI